MFSLLLREEIRNIIGALLIVVFVIQPLSRFPESLIDWRIINPASNHLGWYWASLQSWALSWIWPSSWLVMWVLRANMIRSWLLLKLLVLLHLGFPETSLWEAGFYSEEERWLIGLEGWYQALGKYTILSFLTVVSSRQFLLLPPFILLTGLFVFL